MQLVVGFALLAAAAILARVPRIIDWLNRQTNGRGMWMNRAADDWSDERVERQLEESRAILQRAVPAVLAFMGTVAVVGAFV